MQRIPAHLIPLVDAKRYLWRNPSLNDTTFELLKNVVEAYERALPSYDREALKRHA
jgi:hypothetical protein